MPLRRPLPAGTSPLHPVIRARVGQAAPDFEAGAFVDGGFKNISCRITAANGWSCVFYPGHFTFV